MLCFCARPTVLLKYSEKIVLAFEVFLYFICSDIMMRDNLFEIVTTSRTFYVQVISFYNFGQTQATARVKYILKVK